LLVTSRKLVRASEAFDQADEAEDFQAVGMQCRECLLALVRELMDGSDIGDGNDLPKAADFPAWNERMADAVAAGGSAEHVCSLLQPLRIAGNFCHSFLQHFLGNAAPLEGLS
jgi:hypothetical protein